VDAMGTYLDLPVAEAIRARWKWFLAFGVVLAVLGLIALWNAVDATLITTIYVGFLLIVGGVAQLFAAFTMPGPLSGRLLNAIIGVLYVIVGFDLVADPLAGAITLTIIIAIVLIADGVLRLWSALSERPRHALLLAAIGVINILLGIWLWSGIPASGVAIGFFVGFQLLMAGIAWIGAGWMARPTGTSPGASSA
jgi:uncharacterized membrane protein HdeD (DUF308 family)